jgi:hypothetical protein
MIGLREQIACAEREIAMRRKVYPGLVRQGRMTLIRMEQEISTMEAIRNTLLRIEEIALENGMVPTKE